MSQKLRFTPYAWAKLNYFVHKSSNEVMGFGISDANDPLLVTDFRLTPQTVSGSSVDLTDEGVNALLYDLCGLGNLEPWQVSRVWFHSHPGFGPKPSGIDEQQFRDNFADPDWAIMGIISTNGGYSCRYKCNKGPIPLSLEISIELDFDHDFPAADHAAWQAEFDANVTEEQTLVTNVNGNLTYQDWAESSHGQRLTQQDVHRLEALAYQIDSASENELYNNWALKDLIDLYESDLLDMQVESHVEEVLCHRAPNYVAYIACHQDGQAGDDHQGPLDMAGLNINS